jgi:hypothetical protein
MMLHDPAQIRRGHQALGVAMSWARRYFRSTALGDAKSRDRCPPKIEDEDDDEYENDSWASPPNLSFVICHLSFFSRIAYHNPDF